MRSATMLVAMGLGLGCGASSGPEPERPYVPKEANTDCAAALTFRADQAAWLAAGLAINDRAAFADYVARSGYLVEWVVPNTAPGSSVAHAAIARHRDGTRVAVWIGLSDLEGATMPAFSPRQSDLEGLGWAPGWGRANTEWTETTRALEAQIRERLKTPSHVVVAGHGTGAAIGTLLVASWLGGPERKGAPQVEAVYAFGSPQVGDADFAAAFTKAAAGPRTAVYSIRNGSDPSGTFPLTLANYAPLGQPVYLGETEILIAPTEPPPYGPIRWTDHPVRRYAERLERAPREDRAVCFAGPAAPPQPVEPPQPVAPPDPGEARPPQRPNDGSAPASASSVGGPVEFSSAPPTSASTNASPAAPSSEPQRIPQD